MVPVGTFAEIVHISTPKTSLVVDAEKGKDAKFLYYGNKLSASEVDDLRSAGVPNLRIYPSYGMSTVSETAVGAVHADGNMTLDLVVDNVSRRKDGNRDVTTVALKDKHYPFFVNVNYGTYPDEDVIETWTEISHQEKGKVALTQFASGYLPVRYGDVWLSQLYGSWANEGRVDEAPLNHGMKVIKNKDGARNSHTSHGEVMLSLDGKARENEGRVIGAALCYSGNYKLRFDTDDSNYHHFFAGINEENSEYNLPKNEVFATPPLALTYSEEGLSGVSRNFHKWGRNHKLAHGDKQRKILLNSWEGVYFDINEEGMAQMMDDIASMGGELFVMDDGWFGVKYPRNNDSTSLGDWTVDTRKLPSGIQGLIDTAKKKGIKFGIWIEPEMTNTLSELYEKHPEYIIKPANREPNLGRGGTQLVLDLGNPKVQDLVFHVVDTLMTKYPELDYIKWDANAPIMNHGSQYLTSDNQSHLYIEYHRGFEKVLDRIRAKYPDVTIQACASGGGRANYGVLPWFDEFWVSDNTDALQRVYMQWGTSYFFPAIAMASHISAAPNHQTFRTIPLKYRIDVAMSGRLGMEIQPKNMTAEEIDMCRKAIAEYKDIRPVVQFGDIYRLLSPYDKKGAASLMYVTPEKDKAVYYWWKTETFANQQLPRVTMAGLDPDKNYKVHELNRIDNKPLSYEGKSFSGKFLMSNGLEMPLGHKVDYNKRNDYASRVLLLEEVK
ncbi:MAG TPA: alpha-galactosidase [Muribaculum sp.]|uniref:Alpha-galactosidase n=1 Tax=Heminiphilus faecis TaxID=2601703 RepID=A0ABV4CT59_9BACT|nr:alpha-galactosidase [Heminiphilus faecis]HRF67591.1 alpha-galactosidase [Muribaculum sp.]